MTPEEAKALCIKCHKGQYRRSTRSLTSEEMLIVTAELCKKPALDLIPITTDLTAIYNDFGWRIYTNYHTHPIAVADMMTTNNEKVVAYLHDVIEDTSAELHSSTHTLHFEGVDYQLDEKQSTAIALLTHTPNIPYEEYIEGVCQRDLAGQVKIADMFHNISDNPSEKSKAKYFKALTALLQAI